MTVQRSSVCSDEVDRLLSGRTRDIRLSPALMQAFRDRSFKQTSKIIRAWMVWVVLLNALAVISGLILLPRIAALAMLGPALIIPPSAIAVFFAWARPASNTARDATLIAGMFAILLAVGLMGYSAGGEFLERYLSIMLLVAVTAVIIFNVPQWVTVVIAGVGLAIYLTFQISNPGISNASAISAFLFFASGVASTIVARRTMSILLHRSFLLELRDARRVAELAGANAKLELLSRTDPLTGLSNRRHTGAVLTHLDADRAARRPVALLMCDIDWFKALNDRRGHMEGDRALAQIAAIIASALDPERDHVSRFGGEEFLVVLADVTAEQAVVTAEDIRQRVKAAGISNPDSPTLDVVTVSIGVAAETDHPGASAVDLQLASDTALYEAKNHGRDRVERALPKTQKMRKMG